MPLSAIAFAALSLSIAVCIFLVRRLQAALAREVIDRQRLRQLEAELSAARERLEVANRDAAVMHNEAARLTKRIGELARFEGIANLDQETRRLAAESQAKVEAAAAQATSLVTRAQLESKALVDAASRQADAARAEVAPLAALRDAIRNTLEGYGDRYITITAGLLDGLAEDFGHTDAGRELKTARASTRAMIQAGRAANCEYTEEQRRKTAIAFVLDAFNGKIDSVLADVSEDNFGTLSQKMNDAFVVVNEHGKAFRNAHIEHAYLEARRAELKWAVVAMELRAREREEQRLLKEKIREEERAQREFEKAQREAEKEQSLIQKTLERARKELGAASEEQRHEYEAKIATLNEQLEEARLKGERALSMAQQTKAGHVYVISNVGSFGEDVFKIGLTRRLDPLERVIELGDASVPFGFDVHAMIKAEDAPALEYKLHRHFLARQVNKVNPRKEFFRASLQEIREQIESIGCQVVWTMTAEAREFRETRALELAASKNHAVADQWMASQASVPMSEVVTSALATSL